MCPSVLFFAQRKDLRLSGWSLQRPQLQDGYISNPLTGQATAVEVKCTLRCWARNARILTAQAERSLRDIRRNEPALLHKEEGDDGSLLFLLLMNVSSWQG